MEKQPIRLLIFTSDVKKLLNCSTSKACRKIQQLKDGTGKPKHHEVSIKEYCDYFGIDYTETCKFLNLVK